tara:strand:+ start:20425 stop:20598 length:174 start_codon:yes stop_codon:yes gene_type:complete
MEWILSNKEGLLGIGVALLVLIGTVVRLTKTPEDDKFFNRVLNAVGLGKFTVQDPKE